MSAPTVHIINGPNLNTLGIREPEIYGSTTLAQIESWCRDAARGPLEFRQSNIEGEIVDMVQAARGRADGVIINLAAYSFYSVAIQDALKIYGGPVIELHISNIHARDEDHRHSILSKAVTAVIAGLGARGYVTALEAMYELIDARE
ncbi:type II 3-dehydroquinate dehydratase [Thalassobaculum litoreum]|uniref:3-dehydroquinate dehydratase n=1 Tax=Thalassobaculum litoreum DSM 18839 TaxID=1123362 RepID=A0A8G2EV26_9PROT|nr:type II 3-dehydroquinate dehydratase [Thalassobaculum litoreum]SDF66977.1 3-dehydroquinate dehydratase [Thalassobaculum litoreum DSM 18839]